MDQEEKPDTLTAAYLTAADGDPTLALKRAVADVARFTSMGYARGQLPGATGAMCNLYSVTTNQEAIRRLFRVERDLTGNMPPLPGIFPDQLAPVVRTANDAGRELLMMRWGFPPPPNLGTQPVTNVRNVKSPYWRGWLKPEFRCLVPATSFCEWTDTRPKVTHWFALGEDRPLFAFAGIWRPWRGIRRGEDGEHLLFSFLTCESNDVVRPIHAKAMPVMLTTAEECDAWLSAPVEEALSLQRPFPPEQLRIVATGERKDEAPLQAAV